MRITKADLEAEYKAPVYVGWHLVPENLHARNWYKQRGVVIPKDAKPDGIKGGGPQTPKKFYFLFDEKKYMSTTLNNIKERPVIFSFAMIRAILDGKKTQTRRIIKVPTNYSFSAKLSDYENLYRFWCKEELKSGLENRFKGIKDIKCPYGEVGDQLWVRETWQPLWGNADRPPDDLSKPDGWKIGYVATEGIKEYWNQEEELSTACKPSIHMPRWASRINLKIVNIRVERLQSISGSDALEEGVSQTEFWQPKEVDENPKFSHEWKEPFWDDFFFWNNYPQRAFKNLWNSLHSKEGVTWEDSPWVWVIDFRKI